MVKLVAFAMEDCGYNYKWCAHRQMVCNDNIFVFNVNCVDSFRWAVLLFQRIDVKGEGEGGQVLTSI